MRILLQFLGRGSAFNYQEGNTAAFFKRDRKMLLVDCGEMVFASLRKQKLLDDLDELLIFITHTHSDHVGSLGTLWHYCQYQLGLVPQLLMDFDMQLNFNYWYSLDGLLGASGLVLDNLPILPLKEAQDRFELIEPGTWQSFSVKHVSNLESYGFAFRHKKEGWVIYTGDMNDPKLLGELVRDYGDDLFRLYVDVADDNESGGVHLPLSLLQELIPPSLRRHQVKLMHLSSPKLIKKAAAVGFEVVPISKVVGHC